MRRQRGALEYRRSKHLVLYWAQDGLIFQNYATRVVVTAAPLTVEILHHFDGWLSEASLFERMPEYSRGSLRKSLRSLVSATLLHRSDRDTPSAESAMESWGPWNPHAGFFHFATKDVPFEVDLDEVRNVVHGKLARSSPPPPTKQYIGGERVSLTPPDASGDLAKVLLARRTWRKFGNRQLPLPSLATLLGLTFGVQRWMDLEELGLAALKTSPSGGARHPIEAYVVARKVQGLPSGLYHYAPDSHELELLRRGATSRKLSAFLGGQPWYGNASALVLLTAVVERKIWLYHYPRSYRILLLEAGHLVQTFCLIATSLGLAPFCSAALADSRIESELGLDGIREPILYAAGVGPRPSDARWAPWPDRDDQPLVVEPARGRPHRRRAKRQARRSSSEDSVAKSTTDKIR